MYTQASQEQHAQMPGARFGFCEPRKHMGGRGDMQASDIQASYKHAQMLGARFDLRESQGAEREAKPRQRSNDR